LGSLRRRQCPGWGGCRADQTDLPRGVEEYRYACSPEELEHLSEQFEESERLRCFFEIWTMKESYLKAIGTGLNRDLTALTVRFDPDRLPTLTSGPERHSSDGRWEFQQCTIEDSYVMAVAARRATRDLDLVDVDTLYAYARRIAARS